MSTANESIVITAPTDEPWGHLHPALEWHGSFRESDVIWPSVARYCLAHRLASPQDRERIRAADSLEHAKSLASSLPRRTDADARAFEVLCQALLCSFEQNLELRALLLSTGDRPIEAKLEEPSWGLYDDAADQNWCGRAFMDVRASVARRANDEAAVQCWHQDAERTRSLCVHMLNLRARCPYRRRFTGVGRDYELLCEACCLALPQLPPLRSICEDCFESHLGHARLPDLGMPAFRERASLLRFSHRELSGLDHLRNPLAVAPIPGWNERWLLLDGEGRLWELNTRSGEHMPRAQLDCAALDLTRPVALCVSPRAELAAVAEAYGCRAQIIEPRTGRSTHSLRRGDYHVEHCRFPLAFFEHAGELRLVHGTEWNRLDISDPRSGEVLSARELPARNSGEEERPHELDYFHAGLVVSPDGKRVIDNGWVWHPVGVVRVFSLEQWLGGSLWESEDGPSVRELTCCSYHWDGPVVWLDNETVAVWGAGDDETTLIPAVSLFDANTGELLRSFDGPARGLSVVAPYLIAYGAGAGTSVWDPATGERLLSDPSFIPIGTHPNSHELLSWTAGGQLRVSKLTAGSAQSDPM